MRYFIMKKVLTVILIALLLVSCTAKKDDNSNNDIGKKYIELIKNYQPRDKKVADSSTAIENNDNPEFDAFLDKVFAEAMESDYMNMHFNVIDYKSFNIEKPPVDLGELKYGFDEENFNYMEEQLKELQSFDFDSLSYRQQYDYEALEYSLYETLALYGYYQYNFLFSSGSCLPENIISNFTDFTFYDEESIEDYLTCLKDVDRYFDDALKYTEEQSKDGYTLVDEWIKYTIDTCTSATNKKEDNAFITTFDKRMEKLDFISADKKEEYCKQNKEIVLNEVLPSFEKVASALEKYRGKAKLDDYALYKLDKDYACLQYMLSGSNNADMDQVFEDLKDNLAYMEAEYVSCLYDRKSSFTFNAAMNGGNEILNLVGEECLDYLMNNLDMYYPDLGVVEYDIEVLDPDTAPATAIAYYWPSPIDNHNQNIIRVNPNNMSEGMAAFGTLAHEGFPGHLYQHVYYYKTNPHNFRSSIGFIGYTEGWAVNAQRYCFKMAGIEDDRVEAALFFEDAFYFLLYSIIDIGVNYYGWTEKDIIKYFEEESNVFTFDESTAEYYRNFLIEMPGVYTSYGLGVSNFLTMERDTIRELTDKFDLISYHDTLMKNGPLPFNILQNAVDEYIEARKAQ